DRFETVGPAHAVSRSRARLDCADHPVRLGIDLADAAVGLVGDPDAVVVRVDADGPALADRDRGDGVRLRVDAIDLIGSLRADPDGAECGADAGGKAAGVDRHDDATGLRVDAADGLVAEVGRPD